MKVKLTLSGCDDNTDIEVELNQMELDLMQDIAKRFTMASQVKCQPTMHVHLL